MRSGILVGEANKYFAAQEPWALRKTDPERMKTVLYVTAELIRQVAILAQPYIPDSGSQAARPHRHRSMTSATFTALGERQGAFQSDTPIDKPSPVFPRYVETI